jgi:hypothetical protein
MPKASTRPKLAPFLWPDHVIGKRESRAIREAQNTLYNSHHELLTQLKLCWQLIEAKGVADPHGYLAECVRDAISRAEHEN